MRIAIHLLSVVLAASPCFALHEQKAHLRLTLDALPRAESFRRALAEAGIEDLEYGVARFGCTSCGLGTGTFDYVQLAQRMSSYLFRKRDAAAMVLAGSVLEDGVGGSGDRFCNLGQAQTWCPLPTFDRFSVLRCKNHFQDPDGNGLLASSVAAQRWGYDGGDELHGADDQNPNGYTWLQAVGSYTQGILVADPEQRRAHLEHAFVSIGCNLHLLQDQTSPAHTRRDKHPGHYLPGGEWWGGSSLLEQNGKLYLNPFRNDFGGLAELPRGGNHAQHFRDLVRWTSRNFFSDDTILSADFQHPSEADVYHAAALCDPGGAPARTYVHSAVIDLQGTKLARELQRVHAHSGVTIRRHSLEGLPCDAAPGVPAIDAVIHENLARLVPVAIASSAALLEHFFRGRLEVVQDADRLRVTNRTEPVPETVMDGYLRPDSPGGGIVVVVERVDGRRREVGRRALPFSGLAPLQSLDVALEPMLEEELVGGRAKLIVCLEGARVGWEPGVAARALEWRVSERCPELCGVATDLVASSGDLDGDGIGDVVIANSHSAAGRITAFSGSTCSELWRLEGWSGQGLGLGLVAVGDLDGDGTGDFVARDNHGLVAVSGAGGHVRWRTELPSTGPGANSGYVEVHALGDATADGLADILVLLFPWPGIPLAPWERINVVGGASGERLWSFDGPFMPTEHQRVNVGSDWDGDGVRDLVVFGPDVISSVSAATLYDHQACAPIAWYPHSQLELSGHAGPVFVGNFGGSVAGIEPCADEVLFSIEPVPPTVHLSSFRVLGDVDGDGCEDFAYVGASGGVGVIRNGCSGALLATLPGSNRRALPLGDLDGDGRVEYAYSYTSLDPLQGCVRIVWSR